MMKYFREDLQKRLMSPDFKKQVDGLDILQKVVKCIYLESYSSARFSYISFINVCFSLSLQALPSLSKDIIEVLDILLRWFVLQLCKSNTTCLLKVICNL